ncbi:hypothetical protein N9913_02370, partial [Porticoccaceae bacterium]|nr:hypothetical protein [Porticoccaceae bacterium]
MQLAAPAGDSPLPVLDDLAADEQFAGTVLVDLIPRVVFDAKGSREKAPKRRLAARDRGSGSPSKWTEDRLSVYVQSQLTFRDPRVAPHRVSLLWGRELPKPGGIITL